MIANNYWPKKLLYSLHEASQYFETKPNKLDAIGIRGHRCFDLYFECLFDEFSSIIVNKDGDKVDYSKRNAVVKAPHHKGNLTSGDKIGRVKEIGIIGWIDIKSDVSWVICIKFFKDNTRADKGNDKEINYIRP